MDARGAVRVLDHDPDLAEGLEAEATMRARHALTAPVIDVDVGDWRPDAALANGEDGRLGVLVLEGLLAREVRIVGRSCAELVGAGDLVHPWGGQQLSPPPVEVRWHALAPSRLAVLGRPFLHAVADYPDVVQRLVMRSIERSQSLAVGLAISCITGLRVRLLALLWQLAGRWGKVGHEGVAVPLPLTHAMLGRLVGASRPSVSTALKELEHAGEISRRVGGGYMLHGDPTHALALEDESEPARASR
jgi:hypothetical protein